MSGAFQRTERWCSALGVVAALAGLAFLAASLLNIAGGVATTTFVMAGGVLLCFSLLMFLLAWRRRQRVAFLGRLRARWIMLANAGDPDDQIMTLRRAYTGLIANDLRVRMRAPR